MYKITYNASGMLLTFLAVIRSLTWGAANILKVTILSATWGMDSETDEHWEDIIFPLICDNGVIC